MPFIGIYDGRVVIPEGVEDGAAVLCPACDGQMYPRGPSSDGRARHFVHATGATECDGAGKGESATHRKLKSLAVSCLRQAFEGEYTRCGPEISLDVSATESDVDERRVDALVEFSEENTFFGRGLAIEVQYRNEGKALHATTHDYLASGFSVYWATEADFTDERLPFDRVEQSLSEDADGAYARYHHDASEIPLDEPDPVVESGPPRQSTGGPTYDAVYRAKVADPYECSHRWVRADSVHHQCLQCEAYRRHDSEAIRPPWSDGELADDEVPVEQLQCYHDWVGSLSMFDLDRCRKCGVYSKEFGSRRVYRPEHRKKEIGELTNYPLTCNHVMSISEEADVEVQCRQCGLMRVSTAALAVDADDDPFGLCDDDEHAWEPIGDSVYRCAWCSARMTEAEGREVIRPWEERFDLSDVRSDPDLCVHSWTRGDEPGTTECTRCGIVQERY